VDPAERALSRRLVVVGDALLDRDLEGHVERVSPDAPVPVVDDAVTTDRPGGAALAALMAAHDGADVALVCALGADEDGAALARLLASAGIEVVDLGSPRPTPVKVRIRADGRTVLRLDRSRPAVVEPVPLDLAARRELARADAVLVADYGYGVAGSDLRAALAMTVGRVPVVWDPHPRGGAPAVGTALVTPNRGEAARLVPEVTGDDLRACAERARRLLVRWDVQAVSITRGAAGALLRRRGGGGPVAVPPPRVSDLDPCGAGDRFAAAAALALADGAEAVDAVRAGVDAASAYVAAGGALALGAPEAAATTALEVAERVRARGGTVVATGGCFDLLHAGHVRMLERARRLGDCLLVLVNDDASVRRLKGSGRPIVSAGDRAAVLAGLACVDAVQVFAEDTPVAALERLRPDVFAKGGDYGDVEIPEAAAVRAWGGEFVTLPFDVGRSTTGLIQEVLRRAG
jgi:rfaE bifunctional protein nucleotidyltransferase chain/domain/rfaE bifunctional protein kinase chain/domain